LAINRSGHHTGGLLAKNRGIGPFAAECNRKHHRRGRKQPGKAHLGVFLPFWANSRLCRRVRETKFTGDRSNCRCCIGVHDPTRRHPNAIQDQYCRTVAQPSGRELRRGVNIFCNAPLPGSQDDSENRCVTTADTPHSEAGWHAASTPAKRS